MARNKNQTDGNAPKEKKKPTVIILERDDSLRTHTEQVLREAGWDVTCEHVSKHALETLSQSRKRIFTLFISNFKLPKMEGDDILQKVKSISPLTQRMFMVPSDEPDSLISAINKAEINACITTPFKDNDLILQAKNCYRDFKHALKRAQLKRVTDHQNKQMFKIAQKLKKKSNACKQRIDDKKATIIKLRTRKRQKQNTHDLKTNINISGLIEQKGIHTEPGAYINEFKILSSLIKDSFDTIASTLKIDPLDHSLEQILSNVKETEKSSEPPGNDSDTNQTACEDRDDKSEKSVSSEPEKTSNEGFDNKNAIVKDSKNQESPAKNTPETKHTAEIDNRIDNPPVELIEKILNSAFIKAVASPKAETSQNSDMMDDVTAESEISENILNKYLSLTISKTHTEAILKKIKPVDEKLPKIELADLLDFLRQRQVSYGFLNDEAIKTWLTKSKIDEITIAEGKKPIYGKNGIVKYHFKTDFTNPGKINEDGTIDFRDRGDIPYVEKGDLLAEKTPAIEGTSGISVSGTSIPVEFVDDPSFVAGPGTELSDDELSILAAIDGQPHLDALGNISVNPELLINGDVDYETGNIDFKGNIVVKGIIKEGFTVKGINLTTKEIEGAKIVLTGDLIVAAGITDADISTHGTIYAKFINHSSVMGFGDLNINKEIIDSSILLSGRCINTAGHIMSSKINAKLGIEAGSIGTSASKPSRLIVGIDTHLKTQKDKIREDLEISVAKSTVLKNEIKKFENQDQELYQQISEKAHTQDRAQVRLKELKNSLPELEKSNNLAKVQQITKDIKRHVQIAKTAEKELNDIFNEQDHIAIQIEMLKGQINKIEEKNKKLVLEKKALNEFAKTENPVPVVSVAKTITQDTVIKGPHVSLIIKEDRSRCKIQEIQSLEEGLEFHEMQIIDL